jgi:hypothetical protein
VRHSGASALDLVMNAVWASSPRTGGASVRDATGAPTALKNASWLGGVVEDAAIAVVIEPHCSGHGRYRSSGWAVCSKFLRRNEEGGVAGGLPADGE